MRIVVTGRVLAALCALALCLCAADPGSAKPQKRRAKAPPAPQQIVLVVTGVIGVGAYRQFQQAVAYAKPSLIVLDGPGGVLGEAMLMGGEIRRRGLTTVVSANRSCASACAIVFLSGRSKYMGSGARVGLHSASDLDGHADASATGVMAAYLRDVGVPRTTLRRMAETAPRDIRWLTVAEKKALKIKAFN